ncbi:hypothetical protein OAJ44_03535, partial [Chloroflexi bacterium]|nr:hypothetical protein [Chloroflexota bacterium]
LPINLPTENEVSKFLETVGKPREHLIGTEPVKGREITIEKVAINSVMAGCRPEYFPIILTAVQALVESKFNLHGITASTMGAGILTLVTGPIANEIGINGEVSLFGPGHIANAAIGRALRLIVINCTGSKSGEIDKATLGHAGKYTWCITENEAFRPWTNTGEDRGFLPNANTVSVFAGLSPIQVSNHSSQDPEDILRSFRDALFAAGPKQGEIVIIFCPEHIQSISRAGWTKNQVRDFLYDMAVRSNDEWGFGSIPPGPRPEGLEMTHSSLTPESFTLLVGGGAAGAFSCVIPLWASGIGSQSVTKEVI